MSNVQITDKFLLTILAEADEESQFFQEYEGPDGADWYEGQSHRAYHGTTPWGGDDPDEDAYDELELDLDIDVSFVNSKGDNYRLVVPVNVEATRERGEIEVTDWDYPRPMELSVNGQGSGKFTLKDVKLTEYTNMNSKLFVKKFNGLIEQYVNYDF